MTVTVPVFYHVTFFHHDPSAISNKRKGALHWAEVNDGARQKQLPIAKFMPLALQNSPLNACFCCLKLN